MCITVKCYHEIRSNIHWNNSMLEEKQCLSHFRILIYINGTGMRLLIFEDAYSTQKRKVTGASLLTQLAHRFSASHTKAVNLCTFAILSRHDRHRLGRRYVCFKFDLSVFVYSSSKSREISRQTSSEWGNRVVVVVVGCRQHFVSDFLSSEKYFVPLNEKGFFEFRTAWIIDCKIAEPFWSD